MRVSGLGLQGLGPLGFRVSGFGPLAFRVLECTCRFRAEVQDEASERAAPQTSCNEERDLLSGFRV